MSRLFPDAKTFVDMPTRQNVSEIFVAFQQLEQSINGTNKTLDKFVNEYFWPAGSDILPYFPEDWSRTLPKALDISWLDQRLMKMTRFIHDQWPLLMRQYRSVCNECQSTALPLRYPFVVPGGRFRENYYWDSYWTLEGMLLSGMYTSVRHMLLNFRDMIEQFGHVPNGGRLYYVDRSQPPLLVQMVSSYGKATQDWRFIELEMMSALHKEYSFWMNERVAIVDGQLFNLYQAKGLTSPTSFSPRPESYYADKELSNKVSKDKISQLYQNLQGAAESGWDFSSRWIKNPNDQGLEAIQTVDIIPVDLNAILYENEKILAQLSLRFGDVKRYRQYEDAATRRQAWMLRYLFHSETHQWHDYWFRDEYSYKSVRYLSSLSPLYHGVVQNKTLMAEQLDQFGFLLTASSFQTTKPDQQQQWDAPNIWAPLIHQLWQLHLVLNRTEAALVIAKQFLTHVACGIERHNAVFEKYIDKLPFGEAGNGGEYNVQSGFGWTNGVALIMLAYYGAQDKNQPLLLSCQLEKSLTEITISPANATKIVSICISLIVMAVLIYILYRLATRKRQVYQPLEQESA